jgi:hypothetical protein
MNLNTASEKVAALHAELLNKLVIDRHYPFHKVATHIGNERNLNTAHNRTNADHPLNQDFKYGEQLW